MHDRIKALKTVPIAKLKGFRFGNPKTRTEADRKLLDASLDRHGYVLPIAVREADDGYELIDGHHRLEAIAARGDTDKVKVLILDVESVDEGRLLILSLKNTSSWDMSALEEFTRDMIKDGISADEIMSASGLSASDLDVLAESGSEFLDRLGDTSVGDGTPAGVTDDSASRSGQLTEHVTFSTPLARDQNEMVHAALKLAKELNTGVGDQRTTTGDALTIICRHYIEEKKQ